MIDLKTYEKLKAAVNEKQREADRAKGAFDQNVKQLKEEFGCNSLKEARDKLEQLTASEEKAEQEYDRLLRDFQREWSHVVST